MTTTMTMTEATDRLRHLISDQVGVWWCEEHQSQKWLDSQSGAHRCCWTMFEGLEFHAERCRFVERLLIPADVTDAITFAAAILNIFVEALEDSDALT